MLVLSRNLGESIVIDNEVVVTVAVVGREFVELSISHSTGTVSDIVTVGNKEPMLVAHGVRARFIRSEGEKVRLGFDGPSGCRIDRSENWTPPPR
jgi:sRNA-binding carbon storage regulator CsrA